MRLRAVSWFSPSLFGLILLPLFASAQSSPATSGSQAGTPAATTSGTAATQPAGNGNGAAAAQSSDQTSDPLQRPLTDKQKKANSKALKQELSSTYKKWLNQDVVYIITPEEKSAFKQLSNDEERDQFIEQFWLRRDPTPDTPENEYKEEHYRRIAE